MFDNVGRYLVEYVKSKNNLDETLSSNWEIQFTRSYCTYQTGKLVVDGAQKV